MAEIRKKVYPEYFDGLLQGTKTFELRLNEFACEPGDILVLDEWDPHTRQYTGRTIRKRVTGVSRFRIDDLFWSQEEIQSKGLQIISLEAEPVPPPSRAVSFSIGIGSLNLIKVHALRELLCEYPAFALAKVVSEKVDSGVSAQPKTLLETIAGARTRALGAKRSHRYGVGLESGLMCLSGVKSGYLDVCVCAIYDGTRFFLGISSGWQVPEEMVELIFQEGLDMNQAAHRVGITTNPEIGSAEGVIGVLTGGRLTRKKYTQEAIRMALIPVDPTMR